MTWSNDDITNSSITNTFNFLCIPSNLKHLLFQTLDTDAKRSTSKYYKIEIQDTIRPKLFTGTLTPIDPDGILRKLYFKIDLEQPNLVTNKTKVIPTVSYDSSIFTHKHHQQLEKSTKNNYKYATITAFVIIAILIPGGIVPLYLDGITHESIKIDTQLTPIEEHLAVASIYKELGESQTAINNYNAVFQKDPTNVVAAVGGLTTLSHLENYQNVLRQYNSVIVIDSTEEDVQVLFYPDGIEGAEIIIPREYDDTVLSHPKLDRLTPIVYLTDSMYPEVILSDYGQIMLNSKDAKIIDYPTSDTHTITLEYVSGPDGPHVVYPYGSENNGPAMVFPERAYYPFIVNMAQQDVEPEINIFNADTSMKSITNYQEIILSNDDAESNLFELNAPDDEQPLLIYPDGPDSIPIEFPLGAQYVQIYELPKESTPVTFTAAGIGASSPEVHISVSFLGIGSGDGIPIEDACNKEKNYPICPNPIPDDILDSIVGTETTSDDIPKPLARASATSTSNGGGCRGDCQPPTLGISDDYERRMVDDGFTYNGYTVDVESFYTPYPLLGVRVGQQNTAVLKVYDNSGVQEIRHVGLALNLHPDGHFNESDVRVELDIDFEGLETTTIHDPNDILDDVSITTDVVKCKEEYNNKECLEVTINHSFREELEHNRFATNVWDADRNSWQNTFNHGIKPMGESLNPPDVHIGIHHGQQYTITETGENKAVDEDGNMWTFDREWKRDYIPNGKIVDGVTMHGIDRNNAWFDDYKQEQELLAEKTFQREFGIVTDNEY